MAESANFPRVVRVWDGPTRCFHWTNALCVVLLMGIGLVIYNGAALGLSNDGKVLLKTLHVWVGYLFLVNLLWRLAWAFLGNRYARWRAFLPGGAGYGRALGGQLSALLHGRTHGYVGHSPLGRIAVTLLLLLLLVQGVTGLVLAGTDLYYPPFGGVLAEWVAAPDVDPGSLAPYRPDLVDPVAYESMRAIRAPFMATHEWLFYVLAVLVLLHVAAVIFTELAEGGTLVSAMITGRKVVSCESADAADGQEARA